MNRSKGLSSAALSVFMLCSLVSFAVAAGPAQQPGKQPSASLPPKGKKLVIKVLPAGPCELGALCEFRGTVTDDVNSIVPKVPVSLFLKGKRIKSAQSEADGTVRFLYTILPNDVPVGATSYEIRTGTGQPDILTGYSGPQSAGSGPLTVTKGKCYVLLDPHQKPLPPGTASNTLHVEGDLYFKQGPVPIPGTKTLKLAYAGRNFELSVNDSKFEVDIPLSVNDLTKYKTSDIYWSYSGDNFVLPCSGTKEVKLQGVMPKAWGYHVYGDAPKFSPEVQLGEKVKINVRIHDTDSNAPMANMAFTVDAVNYMNSRHLGSGVTDAKGSATIYYHHIYPIKPEVYRMEVRYNNNGQEYVNYAKPLPGEARENLIVEHTGVDMEVTAPKTALPNELVTVAVRLTRKTDHQPAIMKVRFNQGEITGPWDYTHKTVDSQGMTSFQFNMPPAKAGITKHECELVTYNADDIGAYSQLSRKISISYASRDGQNAGTQFQLK